MNGKQFLAGLALIVALVLIAASCNDSDTTATTVPPTTNACGPTPDPVPGQLIEVDNFISNTLIQDWQAARHDSGYVANQCWHVWTSDDCSAPVVESTGLSFDFTHPCHRHDFGYRNYKRLADESATDTWNEVSKLATDDQLLADAREHCSARAWYLKNQCLAWAQVFYLAVRAFG